MGAALEDRLAHLILSRQTFTADDLTDCGQDAVDQEHRPNGPQSAIGSLFNQASRKGHIAFTGQVTKSAAKHRKGGIIRVWAPTQAGIAHAVHDEDAEELWRLRDLAILSYLQELRRQLRAAALGKVA